MLEKSFLVAFIVLAIHGTMREGMIFGFIRRWMGQWDSPGSPLYDALHKPVMDCNFCMTAWWGSAAYWIIWGNSWHEWITVTIAAMGINFFISIFLPED